MTNPNPTCQHYRINNATRCCIACGEPMVVQRCNTETVLSAPNLAACTNPACLAAIDDDDYDERNPPAGCTNPSGAYIPGREERIIVGWTYDYDCWRCGNDGTVITSRDGVTWSCGRSHKGDTVFDQDQQTRSTVP